MATRLLDSRSGRLRAATALVAGLSVAACSSGSNDNENASDRTDSTVAVDDERCQRNRDAGTITYISGYGYSASAGQMDVFVADELGYFDALCLDVDINAAGADGQQLVSSGQAQVTALGSASDVLLAAANSDNLTAVATYGSTPPFSIFAHESITELSDLQGGQLGYFINLTPIASAMLDASDTDVSEVELVKMTNYDPTVVPRGQVDAIVGYASNQPAKLRAMGESFTEFLPADFGVQGTYNVMEVNTEFLEQNRDVAADFMRADLKALQYCLDNPDECVEIVSTLAEENQQGSAFPLDQQQRTWDIESQWVTDNPVGPPGVQTIEQWQSEHELVQTYGDLDQVPALQDVMDVDLVASLYDDDGELIWPGDE